MRSFILNRAHTIAGVGFWILVACGLDKAKHVEYIDNNGQQSTCSAGTEAFLTTLLPELSPCLTCHAVAGSAAGRAFDLSGNDESKRTALLSAKGSRTAQELFSFLQGPLHGGKSAVQDSLADHLSSWEQAEQSCPQ